MKEKLDKMELSRHLLPSPGPEVVGELITDARRLLVERDIARACLRDAMAMIREIMMVKDVDIDHDAVWLKWASAAGCVEDK